MRLSNFFALFLIVKGIEVMANDDTFRLGGMRLCDSIRKAYDQEIKRKVEEGIPFELMAILFENGALVWKKVIRLQYNLWDELVTIKERELIKGRFSISSGREKICGFLDLSSSEQTQLARSHPFNDMRYSYRLILNPMWAERMNRLRISTRSEIPSGRMVGIRWEQLSQEMPSEKILLEMRLGPQ